MFASQTHTLTHARSLHIPNGIRILKIHATKMLISSQKERQVLQQICEKI